MIQSTKDVLRELAGHLRALLVLHDRSFAQDIPGVQTKSWRDGMEEAAVYVEAEAEKRGAEITSRTVRLPAKPLPGTVIKVEGVGQFVELGAYEEMKRARELAEGRLQTAAERCTTLRQVLQEAVDLIHADATVEAVRQTHGTGYVARLSNIKQVLSLTAAIGTDWNSALGPAFVPGNDGIQLLCKRCGQPFHTPRVECPNPLLDR